MITLITDFGEQDWFVGTIKGVIACIHPEARVVDITHQIPAGDIKAGAFALAASCRYFQHGTIHVVVVDPGVGTDRKALAVRTSRFLFVAPDNGVLSWALRTEDIKDIRVLENSEYFLQPASHTFHGRDVFAPVAAHLSKGAAIRGLGPAAPNLVQLEWPEAISRGGLVEGEVVYIDRFGNALTNIENRIAEPAHERNVSVYRSGRLLARVLPSYQSVPTGKIVAVPGSAGFLEVAVNGGNAARRLGLKVGTRLSMKPSSQ